jgi:hypothetical protein
MWGIVVLTRMVSKLPIAHASIFHLPQIPF